MRNILVPWRVIPLREGFRNRTLDTFALTFSVKHRKVRSRCNFMSVFAGPHMASILCVSITQGYHKMVTLLKGIFLVKYLHILWPVF